VLHNTIPTLHATATLHSTVLHKSKKLTLEHLSDLAQVLCSFMQIFMSLLHIANQVLPINPESLPIAIITIHSQQRPRLLGMVDIAFGIKRSWIE
jgi:hypothetical protein